MVMGFFVNPASIAGVTRGVSLRPYTNANQTSILCLQKEYLHQAQVTDDWHRPCTFYYDLNLSAVSLLVGSVDYFFQQFEKIHP